MGYHFDHGFRFASADLHEIHRHMMDLRREVAAQVYWKTAEWLARRSVANLDRWRVFGRKGSRVETPYSAAILSLADRQARLRTDRERAPAVDFSVEISVIPFGDKVLGLYFIGQPEFADLIRSKPWFIDHRYNSDPDPDVPAREWKRRRDDWTAVVEQNVLPALNGFTAFISAEEPDVVPHPRDLLQYVPVFSDRLDALVRARLFTEYSARLPESAFRQNASQTVAEFQNWRLTRTGKWKWNKAAAEIAPRLTRKITGRHLTGWKKR